MKKLLFILCCTMAFLSSCSNDDLSQDNNNENNATAHKIRWYGVKTLNNQTTTRGVADEANLWNQRVGIYIKFLNDPKGNVTLEKIQEIASEWEQYAGVKFHFVNGDAKATVRIAFDWNDNDWLTWSYTGTDAKMIKDQTQPTAVFGGLQYQNDEQLRGDVLRVFGQILGLEYEQRHQDWDSWRSETKLENYWTDMFDGMNMDWDQIREYVFTPLTQENAVASNQTPEIDELSIMAWPYYSRVQTSKLIANFELSEGDKAFIAELYPKEKQTLPTIQEAWVDTGFFEWATKDNWKMDVYDDNEWVEGTVALRITKLGSEQQYLPDVSDGEQLTSARGMFSFHPNYLIGEEKSRLIKAPKFNTSNISDFSYMFSNSFSLTEVQMIDTSNGTNFTGMFQTCSSLEEIPLIDTSNGTNFSCMFYGSNLKIGPLIDTSNGTNFSSMFDQCYYLKYINQIKTSNGTNFSNMFHACKALVEITYIDTSNGIDFNNMFASCQSIRSIPILNTTKGINFSYMFFDCYSLPNISLLDTSNGITFGWMFSGCYSLTEISSFDTSKATNFSMMFSYCESLTSIPSLNTSNVTDFSDMFAGCLSLTNIPNLDTSKGTNFSDMFNSCSSLQEKPNLDLSSATNISNMYDGTPFANDPI